MSHLEQLSPAEALMIQNGWKVRLKELLKVTFMDLLFRKVLKSVEKERQPSVNDPIRYYNYIQAGEHFDGYKPKGYERVFVDIFYKSSTHSSPHDIEILFRSYVKMAYQEAGAVNAYKMLIVESKTLIPYYIDNLILMYFGGFFLNKKGKELKAAIKTEIAEVEKSLRNGLMEDSLKVRELIFTLGAGVLLLKAEDAAMLIAINKDFVAHADVQEFTGNDGVGFAGCGDFDFFTDFSSDFDSSCGGDNGCNSDSGCNSNNGCSSDSSSSCSGGGCSGCSS